MSISHMKKVGKIILFFICTVLLISMAVADAATFNGYVRDTGGSPIAGIWVQVWDDSCDGNVLPGVGGHSGSDGSFQIINVPDGTHYIMANPASFPQRLGPDFREYVDQWWEGIDPQDDCLLTTPVTVSGNDTISGINFALDVGGSISGKITNGSGTPVEDAWVQAWYNDVTPGYVMRGIGAHTDANGDYTIHGVPPGPILVATNNVNDVIIWWDGDNGDPDPAQAETINIQPDSMITEVNIVHHNLSNISGTVYQSDGTTPLTGVEIAVHVFSGNPCGGGENVGSVSIDTSNGTYTTTALSPGDYYLRTSNRNQSNYVNEWWAGPVSVTSCSGAQSVTVSTVNIIDKDFQLDDGFSISGMVYQSDGSTPIPDNNVWVEAYTGDPCEDHQWIGFEWTSSGAYTIMGLPPGDYYLRTTSNTNESVYASEWWANPASAFYCSEAQTVIVTSADIADIDFQLDIGGSITGVVVNDSGVPQANLEVDYWNDLCSVSKIVTTAVDGSFEIIGLPPGLMEIEIEPDVDTGLAMYVRTYSCLALGESSDLGTIELQHGALIAGVLQDAASNPLSDVDFWCGAKFEVALGETDVDGSFEFRLPMGTYLLGFGDENEYSRMPVEITVSDVGTPHDLGILTSYDASSGQQISGTVGYGGYAGPGEFKAIAFLNTTEITPENFAGIQPIANAEPDQATGEYSLYVVPQASRPGTTINAMLLLVQEGTEGWESVTLVDKIEGIVTSGTPVTGQNLAYSTSGSDYTVSGFVKNSEGGVVQATVLLYKQPGDEFFGFAETDCDGAYALYNVPAGTYRIAATAYGYDVTEWTAAFNVVSTNVTISDIFMGSSPGDELAADFGSSGIYHYDNGTWTWITSSNPEDMVGVGTDLYADFGTSGIYKYDGSWTWITSSNPDDMVAVGTDLYADFGSAGIYKYDGSWSWITSSNPEGMVAVGTDLYVDFGSAGIYKYDGTWTWITSSNPEDMVGVGTDLYADFGSAGIYKYDGSWSWITSSNPENMVAVDIND